MKTNLKQKLLSFGYIDNEFLELYLNLVLANLNTVASSDTQAHHIIPVSDYWTSDAVYNRQAALRLANKDADNIIVNLLYKDHLKAHAYLTLCTNLDIVQIKYSKQAILRKINSHKALGQPVLEENNLPDTATVELINHINSSSVFSKEKVKELKAVIYQAEIDEKITKLKTVEQNIKQNTELLRQQRKEALIALKAKYNN